MTVSNTTADIAITNRASTKAADPTAINDTGSMHRIVIVGGGAGGLSLACRLGRKFRRNRSVEVVLVDQRPTHLWKPLLHEVATGSLDGNHDAVSYISLARKNSFRFMLAALDNINTTDNILDLSMTYGEQPNEKRSRTLRFNQLVIAIGSLSNDFGIQGVAEHAIFLDGRPQAEYFHQLFVSHLHRINNQPPHSDMVLSVVIVGGGATGVELAADLHSVASQLEEFGFPTFSQDKLRVSVLEASDRLLAQLPARISASVNEELEALGVNVCTGAMVTEITDTEVVTADGGRFPTDLSVWAAGIRAPELLTTSGLAVDGLGRVKTNQQLTLPDCSHVFVIGDCCHCPMENTDKVVPPRAQSAHQMAALTYRNVINQYRQKPLQTFTYRDYGSLVSLSQYSTVGNLMGNLMRGSLFIEGWIARLVYRLLYRRHQSAVHGVFATALIILGDIIHRRTHSHLKLH